MRDCETSAVPAAAAAGQFNQGCAGEAALKQAAEADWQREREARAFQEAFQVLLRADQYRQDSAFMERLRVWMRGERAKLDSQLDRIGS